MVGRFACGAVVGYGGVTPVPRRCAVPVLASITLASKARLPGRIEQLGYCMPLLGRRTHGLMGSVAHLLPQRPNACAPPLSALPTVQYGAQRAEARAELSVELAQARILPAYELGR